jgi:ferredoxin--NADP+ reductase
MTNDLGLTYQPLRVAIIGSGPSAFYAADHLQKQVPNVEIDMFERLPTPHGLVRGGVAPDHPRIKNVTKVYDKIAAQPGFHFYGNVEFGRDILLEDLRQHYHAVIYAVGAQTDRQLGVPGEDLIGSHAATEFVGWYNAHPDFRDEVFDLNQSAAAVIGNGNVAMDVARILASCADELRGTDIADYALEALEASRVTDIYVLGRRGPAQAAYTNAEIKELGALREADVIVLPEEAELDPLSREALEASPDRVTEANVSIISGYAQRPAEGKPRRIHMRFLLSPVELIGDAQGRVRAIRVVKNVLVKNEDGSLRAQATDETEEIPVGLVFRSIGYKGVALPDVPFDSRRAVIPNRAGRVIDPAADGAPRTGEYAAGWIKRGPSGVIGTNKPDSIETVNTLLEDASAGDLWQPEAPDRAAVEQLLSDRNIEWVSYEDWLLLDQAEQERGAAENRPRVKFSRVDEMLNEIRARKHVTEPGD